MDLATTISTRLPKIIIEELISRIAVANAERVVLGGIVRSLLLSIVATYLFAGYADTPCLVSP